MVTGADAHGLLVDDLRDVVGVDALEEERDRATADLGVEGTVDREAVAEATLRPDHPAIAVSLNRLANPVMSLGDIARATALRERALAIAEKAFGPDHFMVAHQLNDMANTLVARGDYVAAQHLYERARVIYERGSGSSYSDDVATTVLNMATVSANLGDFVEAARLERQAIAMWEREYGRQHPFVALALMQFADTLASQGRDREAIASYERAASIQQTALRPENASYATTLARLAVDANASEMDMTS